jgi:hypothetical protein
MLQVALEGLQVSVAADNGGAISAGYPRDRHWLPASQHRSDGSIRPRQPRPALLRLVRIPRRKFKLSVDRGLREGNPASEAP